MQAFYRAGVNKPEGGVCRHSIELDDKAGVY